MQILNNSTPKCLVCNKQNMNEILDFGKMALAGGFLLKKEIHTEKKFRMRLCFCKTCYSLQITDIVDKNKIFNNYFYFSSAIGTLKNHFNAYALEVCEKFLERPNKSTVVEIGCNDGVLLKPLSKIGIGNLIGVDPATNVIKSISDIDAHLINNYFGSKVSKEIIDKFGKVDVVCANNVYAHLSNFREVTKGIAKILNNDGVFIFEVHYIEKIINEIQYDMIYHEHLFYHSYLSLKEHFNKYGFHIFDVEPIDIHGGSMRYYVSNINSSKYQISNKVKKLEKKEKQSGYNNLQTFLEFSHKVKRHKNQFLELIRKLKTEGHRIAGYGASGRANTLIQYCGLDNNDIDFIIDDAPKKSGFITPGSHIPIINRNQLITSNSPDYLIIFAWSFYEEIYSRLKGSINNKTKIILPFPEIKIIEQKN